MQSVHCLLLGWFFLQDTDAMVGKGADSLIIQSKFNCADDTVDTTQVQILSPYEVPYR
jgi:hypothetical protein